MLQAKLGLDRNANKKKKKKKVAVVEEGPSKATELFLRMGFEYDENNVLSCSKDKHKGTFWKMTQILSWKNGSKEEHYTI